MRIPLLNLKKQYENLRSELEPEVLRVLNSAVHVLGPTVRELEEKIASYIGAKHAIACANGTDALYISMLALDIKPGDEVITTPFTFIATSEAVDQVGARPVFADIDPETYNIDPTKIEEKITDKTKAIIVVHLYGQCCDMEAIMKIAKKHNLKVVEDAAQAIGSKDSQGRYAGSIGDIGTFSFYPTKNLGCAGDGGMLSTNCDELNARLRRIRVHGSDRRYYHDEMGVNSRLDEMQAAILLIKLKHLCGWNEHRNQIADLYDKAFSEINGITPPKRTKGFHVYHQYTISVDAQEAGIERDSLKEELANRGIASEVYYPVPLHLQKIYSYLNHEPLDFPNTLKASEDILCLPISAELSLEEAKEVVEAIREIIKSPVTA